MSLGSKVQDLGRFLEACEHRRGVERVNLTEVSGSSSARGVTADIELKFSTCPADGDEMGISFVGASVGDDGEIQLTFEPTDSIVLDRLDGVGLEFSDATFDSDGTVSVILTASTTTADSTSTDETSTTDVNGVPTTAKADDNVTGAEGHAGRDGSVENADERTAGEAGSSDGRETEDEEQVTGERDVPPFRNPELLRDIYESCDTFAEMQDALDMDITAETVRRYMISHGIHEPNSYDTAGDDESEVESPDASDDDFEAELLETGGDVETPDVIADGIGLPENVSVDALIDTVQRANTLYEVQTEFGIDRDEAVSMLRQTGLIHHVVGRLSEKGKREVSREMVIESLRQQIDSG